jgi:hypothetical protein
MPEPTDKAHDLMAALKDSFARAREQRAEPTPPPPTPDLFERIEAAIEEDAQIHPVSGRPNRDHWAGILIRHRSATGHCWDAYLDRAAYDGPYCPEIIALARRLHTDPDVLDV